LPRKGPVPKRDVMPDPIYGNKLVTRLINKLMLDGKRGVSQKIVYDAFEEIRGRSGKEPMEVFEEAIRNIMPVLEVKARRVGGSNYQVPIEVRQDRCWTLGSRWLVNDARLPGGNGDGGKLANELLDAANNTGGSVKKKEDTHRMAEANKAFAHYRW